jgi:hypothetical protein
MLLLAHFLLAAGIGGVLAALVFAWHAYEPHHKPEALGGQDLHGAAAQEASR